MAKPESAKPALRRTKGRGRRHRIDGDFVGAVVVIALAVATIVLILSVPFGY
jgi:hypothetical protein